MPPETAPPTWCGERATATAPPAEDRTSDLPHAPAPAAAARPVATGPRVTGPPSATGARVTGPPVATAARGTLRTAALAVVAVTLLGAGLTFAWTGAEYGPAAARSPAPSGAGVALAAGAARGRATRAGHDPAASRPVRAAARAGGRPTPAAFVRRYYAALDAGRYAEAWRSLSPAVQARFGRRATWRAGYAATLYSRPRGLMAAPAGDGAMTVRHVLTARDRGCRERRFAVTWRLAPTRAGWSATALSAAPLGATGC